MKKTELEDALKTLREIRKNYAFQKDEAALLTMARDQLKEGDAFGAFIRLDVVIAKLKVKLLALQMLKTKIPPVDNATGAD